MNVSQTQPKTHQPATKRYARFEGFVLPLLGEGRLGFSGGLL